MGIDLTSSIDDRKRQFASLLSFDNLAELLEVKPGYLNYVLYKIPLEDRYTTFTIPKKSGDQDRTIHSPIPPIKIIQRKLKQVLEHVYEPRYSVHGFVARRNIVTNTMAHKRSQKYRRSRKLKYVLNVDLEDFFPSIHFGRVRGLFHKRYELSYEAATWLAQICCFQGGLPQGAPTSPIISNLDFVQKLVEN
jgi:RNA-directed DNA polymerase